MYWNIKRSEPKESAAADWLALGGTAQNGTTYGPPSSAVAWGKVGCPLVPRIYRIRFGQQTAPPLFKRALKAPHLTLNDLDSEFLGRSNMAKIPPQINDALSTLFYQLPVLNEVAIPAGIPVSWLTKLPLKGRLRNALGRFFWPHILVVKKPLRCAELMAIPAIGKASLHELLCVLESAESGKNQDGVRIAPSARELSTLTVGSETRDRSGVISPSERRSQEKDETEHGGNQSRSTNSPSVSEMTARILGRENRRHSGERATPEKRSQDKDETEHGGIQPESINSPSVSVATARSLEREKQRHAGERTTREKRSQDKDETEHGGIQPEGVNSPSVSVATARSLKWEKRRNAGETATLKKRSQDKDEKEQSRTQVVDNDEPREHGTNVKTAESAFQKAVNETARQAIRAGFLKFDSGESLPTVIDRESEVACTVSALGDLLREFASWARAETDAQTIGDAISNAILRKGTVEEWQAIAEFSLNQAGYVPNHPYTILESWANNLPERERHIFDTRIAHLDATTSLQDLGDFFDVTRERVRQLEAKLRKELIGLAGGKEGKPIRWRAKTVRQMIGVASPPVDQIDSATGGGHRAFSTQIENLLSPLPGQTDFREVVLMFAGPYELINGWLVLKSAVASDPTRRIREMTDSVGFIDHDQATKALNKWGLDTSLHEEWLVRDGKIRKLSGRLVRWDGSIGDKLVIALADIGRPATIEALLKYIGEDRARTSSANALSIDPRAVRISRTEWALASWGLSEYSSIAMSIRNVLKSQENPTSIEEVVAGLMKDLGLKESSIRAYCQAPMFVIESGAIRLRRDDEPYTYDNVSLKDAKGVFALSSRRVSLLFEVDAELLRGSGRSLASAAGFLLGVVPNRPMTFNNQDGLSVTLTFPETSISGPSVGSIRRLAETSGARLGDFLTLTLDKSDMSVTAVATDLAQHDSGWQLVSNLTGIETDEGLEGLAASLQCEKGEIRALLSERRDDVVLDALPKRSVSSELDQAFASLEAQLQQTGGSPR